MKANEAVEMMTKTVNANYDNLRKLADINLSAFDKLTALQMSMMQTCLDAGSKRFEVARDSKRMDELVTKQVEMTRECGETMLSKNREMLDLLSETRDAYQEWVEASVSKASEQLSEAAEAVTEAAKAAA